MRDALKAKLVETETEFYGGYGSANDRNARGTERRGAAQVGPSAANARRAANEDSHRKEGNRRSKKRNLVSSYSERLLRLRSPKNC
ncbi:hypothetical protein L596_025893 [Steinernema carpocapsae]|uniref:Uncharacterized protein n=1 Tax=Steinernema carpocapsae TaxID=34508 RepID=A0A4U5M932_STECR|nr:hypothetical protein L596_025893 [Steinernema carpocapsae]